MFRSALLSAAAVLILLPVRALPALDVYTDVLEPARALVGSPYCRGSASPPCFDCSGFVTYLYHDYVPSLPRISRDMAHSGTEVPRGDLQPGDLVFFATGADRTTISHVAIYAGQNSIIHAISDGPNRGVTITELTARYWRTRFAAARRVLPQESGLAIRQTDGSATFARGSYRGELRNGQPEGRGVLEMNNGDIYEGSFRNGIFDGEGVYTWSDGSTFAGSFAGGELTERGTFTPARGDQKETPPQSYFQEQDSPWETFDGVVEGDFGAWLDAEQDAFEAWKKNN